MPRCKPVLVITLGACLGLSAPAARAQQARLDITVNQVQACDVYASAGTVVTATVSVVNAHPFQTVRFKAPVPCGMFYGGDSSGNLLDGNSQTGVTVTMPACTSIDNFTPVPVLTIVAFTNTPISACSWDVAPADGDSDILLTDCDGNTMKGASARALYCGDVDPFVAPYLPDPPDGATDVPVNTHLAFTGFANEVYLRAGSPDQLWNYVACSEFYGPPSCGNPFDPGLLQPYTTYYWRTAHWCGPYCQHGEGALSDVWSFTTGSGPVATEQSTWGRVKALYRD